MRDELVRPLWRSLSRALGGMVAVMACLWWAPVALPVLPLALTAGGLVFVGYLFAPDIQAARRKREERAEMFALRKQNEALLYTLEQEEKAYQARRDGRRLMQDYYIGRVPFDRASAEGRGLSQARWKRATDYLVGAGLLSGVGQGKTQLLAPSWREAKKILDGCEQQQLSGEF